MLHLGLYVLLLCSLISYMFIKVWAPTSLQIQLIQQLYQKVYSDTTVQFKAELQPWSTTCVFTVLTWTEDPSQETG